MSREINAKLSLWSGESMSISPEMALETGAVILGALMDQHQFVYTFLGSGQSSGGNYATGAFVHANRKLELNFRHTLGMVSYHLGDRSISHATYMWSVIGRPHASRYPGFSGDPLDGFRDLSADIENYGVDFLSGTDVEFLRHFKKANELERMRQKLPG